MTMRIVYLQTHESHESGKDYFIEVTLARRLCEKGIAIPYAVYHKERIEAETIAKQGAAAAAEAEKKKSAKKPAAKKAASKKKPPVKRTKKIEKAVTL